MINKVSQMQSKKATGLRGGEGDACVTHLFDADKLSSKLSMCAKVTLEPGSSIGKHAHETDAELYIVISGSGKVDDNGTLRDIAPGDAVWTANGESHSVINTGEIPLEMYAIVVN